MEKKIIFGEEELKIDLIKDSDKYLEFTFEGQKFEVELIAKNQNKLTLNINGVEKIVSIQNFDSKGLIQAFSGAFEAYLKLPGKTQGSKNKGAQEGSLVSPMPGKIFKVLKKTGDKIQKGESILILEAMKMEHTIKATNDGIIKSIFFKEGEQVTGGAELCEIES